MIGMIPNKLIDNWLSAVARALHAWTVVQEVPGSNPGGAEIVGE